ncbi:MAG TPA: O-antigen ligase family protein [Sediminibacterium sp.]|nr:O-antigen ligase family protein [Sediminibacterium sp.]
MNTAVQRYQVQAILAGLLFFAFGALSILQQRVEWMAIPFVWVLLPAISNLVTAHTGSLYWLMLVMLPLSAEINITDTLGMDFPDELLLLAITAAAVAKMIHQPQLFYPVFRAPLLLFILIHLLWITFCAGLSTEPLLSVKFLLAKTWYIIPLVLVTPLLLRNMQHYGKLAICLLIPLFLVIVQTLVRHGLHGFEFATINKTVGPFFRNHVNYSAMLVCLLPVGWAAWHFTKATAYKKRIAVALGIALAGLATAYSRGAWLALLIVPVSVWIFQKKRMGSFLVTALAATGLLLAVLTSNNYYLRFAPDHDRTIFHTNFREHLGATITLKDVSNAERFHRWVAGVRMVTERPLTGFGPNSFYNQYRPYTVSAFKTWVSNNPEHSTVHNYFLLTAIEQGIPGLVILLLLWAALLLAAQQLYHAFQSEFYRTIALITGVVLCMIMVINFTSDMIETDKVGGLFWLSAGILISLQLRLKEEKSALAA